MNRKVQKRVGVKDIAEKSGVSIGTVDRVLHNRGEVKEETREKVMAIVKELGYTPNVLARSLSTKKTTRIAIVIPDSSDNNPYWEKPVIGIKKATDELASFNIEIIYEYFDASSEKSFKEVLEGVCDLKPDGIVLNPVFKSISLHYISAFNARKIPYVFIDINIKGVGKLGYFGQDAEQSGFVAAKIMDFSIPQDSNVLIVKQSNKKVFSQHIESRIVGFLKYFTDKKSKSITKFVTLEIDLLDRNEPELSLTKLFDSVESFAGIFVPNSRVFKVAEFIEKQKNEKPILVGFDLVDKNIQHLEKGNISYLLSQKPEEQAYKAIMALFDNLIAEKEVKKTNYSPIDIIIKENIEYYKINK